MIPDFNSTSDKTIWDALRRAGAPLRLRKGRIIYLQGQLPQSLYLSLIHIWNSKRMVIYSKIKIAAATDAMTALFLRSAPTEAET